ncbi:MAG: signal peptidase I [Clostridiales bacterium]|nr:signal peptidase I [Clostridiales bacterium]
MKTASRICNILFILIVVIIIAFSGTILLLQLLGYKPMAVLSGSMRPTYQVGALVFVNTNLSPEEMQVGDPATFFRDEDTFITHRIVSVDFEAKTFRTKGDANNTEDATNIPFANYVGKPVLHIPQLGYAMMNLNTTKGFAAGAILVAVLIILFIIPILLEPDKPAASSEAQANSNPAPLQESEKPPAQPN